MIAQKFATLKSNLTFFIGLSVSSFIVKIIVELSYNVANGMNKSDWYIIKWMLYESSKFSIGRHILISFGCLNLFINVSVPEAEI